MATYQRATIAAEAARAYVIAARAIASVEALMAGDQSAANTLGDGVEQGLIDLRSHLGVLRDAALRLDRTVDLDGMVDEAHKAMMR